MFIHTKAHNPFVLAIGEGIFFLSCNMLISIIRINKKLLRKNIVSKNYKIVVKNLDHH